MRHALAAALEVHLTAELPVPSQTLPPPRTREPQVMESEDDRDAALARLSEAA